MDEVKPKSEVPLCVNCHTRKGYAPGGLCRVCYDAKRAREKEVPPDLAKAMGAAKTQEDWLKLANSLADVIQGVADGSVKASAAQTAMLKDIMSRAYGKPVATQQEKRVAAGVVILPTLNSGEKTMICPRCGYNAEATLEK